MKKIKKLFLLTAISVLTLGCMSVVSAATAPATTVAKTIPVNKVPTIAAVGYGSSERFEWGSGADNLNTIYKLNFTIDAPSYVCVQVSSTVSIENYPTLGAITAPIVFSSGGAQIAKTNNSSNIIKNNNSIYNTYLFLEKGDYSVIYNGKTGYYSDITEGYLFDSVGIVTTAVYAQPITRTGNVAGIAPETAIPLANGVYSKGYISNIYGEQYYELKLSKESEVTFDASINTPVGYENFCVDYNLIDINGTDYTKSLNKASTLNKDNMSIQTAKVKLPAGTYYFKMARIESVGQCNLKAIVSPVVNPIVSKPVVINKKILSKPKLTSYKKNSKKIVGKAVANSTVKITVGTKTYTVKANNKGNFTVKLKKKLKKKTRVVMYAKKTGYVASKKVTYRVK